MSKERKEHDHLYLCLGEVIQKRRRQLKLSQEELSRRASINRPFLSNVEQGKRNPSIGALTSIAEGLETRVSKLMLSCEECIKERQDSGTLPGGLAEA